MQFILFIDQPNLHHDANLMMTLTAEPHLLSIIARDLEPPDKIALYGTCKRARQWFTTILDELDWLTAIIIYYRGLNNAYVVLHSDGHRAGCIELIRRGAIGYSFCWECVREAFVNM